MLSRSASYAPKVLIVDDHEDSRFMFKYVLESKGYCALEASDGLEAIEVARQARPNLILMDMNLPQLDGLATSLRIRADKDLRDTTIVIVSGHVLPQDEARAFAAGCDGYITKPINFVNFYDLLDHFLPVHTNAA